MPLSVLIVSYGVREPLRRCLAALHGAVEVIVVDNASPDGTADMVRADFPAVRLVAWTENRGVAKAVNFTFNDPRTITPAQPLAVYGGFKLRL